MRNPIACALIPLVLWLLMLTLPPTGRHRTSRSAQQRRRRRTLWLATVGVDLDRRDIHAGAAR